MSTTNQSSATLKGVLGIAWILSILGLYAIFVRATKGLTPTHLGNTVAWGLWVSLYIYFIGLSAGSFLLSTLVYVFGIKRFEALGRLAVWQAFICLLLGIVFIWVDLGRMSRFMNPLVYFQANSVLSWEILFYVFYMIILLYELYLLSKKTEDAQGRNRIMRLVRTLGIIGIPVAICVHGGTGAIFAVVKARPYWYSALFPIVFLVSALVSGGGLILFTRSVMCRTRKCSVNEFNLLKALALLVIGILAFDLLLLFSEFLVGLYGEIPSHVTTFKIIAGGPFWWIFWIVQIGLGVIVPLFLTLHPKLNTSCTNLGWAGLLVFFGIFGVRLNIIIPPFATPEFHSLPEVFHSVRMSTHYFPSLAEWLLGLGIVSMGTLVFYYGIRSMGLDREILEGPEHVVLKQTGVKEINIVTAN